MIIMSHDQKNTTIARFVISFTLNFVLSPEIRIAKWRTIKRIMMGHHDTTCVVVGTAAAATGSHQRWTTVTNRTTVFFNRTQNSHGHTNEKKKSERETERGENKKIVGDGSVFLGHAPPVCKQPQLYYTSTKSNVKPHPRETSTQSARTQRGLWM